MNYVEAVIMELQRLLNIAPVAVAHRAMVDTQLLGHEIPKNTTLLVCLRSLHMDKMHWENPEEFNPDRFLDTHGNLKRSHDDWFAPFGFGKDFWNFFSSFKNHFTIVFSRTTSMFR